jgi:hypothetical protein
MLWFNYITKYLTVKNLLLGLITIITSYIIRHFLLNSSFILDIKFYLQFLELNKFEVIISKDIIASFIALFSVLGFKGLFEYFIEEIYSLIYHMDTGTDSGNNDTSYMNKGNNSNTSKSGGSSGRGSGSKGGGSYEVGSSSKGRASQSPDGDSYSSSDSNKGSGSKDSGSKYKKFKFEYKYPTFPNDYLDDHDLLKRTDFSRTDKVDLEFFKTIPTEKLRDLLFLAEEYKRVQRENLKNNSGVGVIGAFCNYVV